MQDRPSKIELLKGVEHFLSNEAVVQLKGPEQFHARVAANAVRMVLRELEGEEADLLAEYEGLKALLPGGDGVFTGLEASRGELLAMNEALYERIRAGDADSGDYRARVIAHLREVTLRKLQVVNPAMAELLERELKSPAEEL